MVLTTQANIIKLKGIHIHQSYFALEFFILIRKKYKYDIKSTIAVIKIQVKTNNFGVETLSILEKTDVNKLKPQTNDKTIDANIPKMVIDDTVNKFV